MLSSLLGSSESDDSDESNEQTSNHDYDKIAAPRVSFTGAVHSSGEAYVTVNRLHGDVENVPIAVRGSVHQTGASDLTINNRLDYSEALPDPADDAKGFTSMVEDELRGQGAVHSAGNMRLDIGRLVVIPNNRPEIMVALYHDGYDVYDEIDFDGSIHSTGSIEASIEDLYLYPES